MSRAISTRQLIQSKVHDLDGNPIGKIDEVIIEMESGYAAYLIIGSENREQCVLPFEMLDIKQNPLRVTAAVRRDIFSSPASKGNEKPEQQ